MLFWGAQEAVHRCGRAYAQTTRVELGISTVAAVMRKGAGFGQERNMARIAVGLAPQFSNRTYLTQTLTEEFGIAVEDTLEATLEDAVEIIDQWTR